MTLVALDHFVWSLDFSVPIESDVPYEKGPAWKPDTLPGKRGFDTAHKLLGSKVRAVVGDFMTMDLSTLGTFDWVIYSGILYHMKEPVTALERLRQVTGRGTAVVETEAIVALTDILEHFYSRNIARDEIDHALHAIGGRLRSGRRSWRSPPLAGLARFRCAQMTC